MIRNRKNLLVTGGSSYLGRHLTAQAVDSFNVYATYNHHPDQVKAGQPIALNVADRADVLGLICDLAPDIIIHTAAINPGQGDADMMRVNRDGSRNVAEAAVAVGARLIHLSTDVLHDGRNAPYADDALPSPLNLYGQSKAAAEAAVMETALGAVIVRTSLIYGLKEMDHGTASFVERLAAGHPLVLFKDVIRQPIWVESLVEALLKLAELDVSGRLNIAGRQALSRAEFGRRMLDWWEVDPRGLLQAGRSADISSKIPLDLRLSIDKAERLLGMTFPGVDEVLDSAEANQR